MKKYQTAFTLIELLTVVAIIAILAVVAVPSFDSSIKNNRIQTQLRSVSSLFKYARSEAVSAQRFVSICHLNGMECDNNWSQGVTVFYDDDGNGFVSNAATDILKVYEMKGTNTMKGTASDGNALVQVIYDFEGKERMITSPATFTNVRGTVKICDQSNDLDYARAFVIESTGAVAYSRINTLTGVYKDVNGNDLTCP